MGLAIAENRILVLQRTAQVIQIVPLEMPVDMSYESDSDDDAPKTQNAKRSNNKAPSLNDSEAFPETLGGGAPVEASAVPNFAGLAASFQGQELAQSQRAEPVRKPVMRLPRVHKIYKDRSVANKPLSNDWTLYVDEGIQGSEKSAECESTSCGTIHTMKEFFPAWTSRNCSHTVMPGSNIRLFKTDQHTSPSVLDTTLEQGGKWSIPVSKTISRDMFEELALYLLDERLGETVVGTVFAIRDEVDLLQIWLSKAPSPDAVGKMTADITSVLGLADDVSPPDFVSHQSAFKKANKVKKYFLVEPSPRGLPFDSQATALKPRSRIDTSERKVIKKEKKKSCSKPNSRRNSKKEKKSSIDEFEGLQPQRGAVIPLPVFMAAGGAIFLLLAMAAYTYTSGATQ